MRIDDRSIAVQSQQLCLLYRLKKYYSGVNDAAPIFDDVREVQLAEPKLTTWEWVPTSSRGETHLTYCLIGSARMAFLLGLYKAGVVNFDTAIYYRFPKAANFLPGQK